MKRQGANKENELRKRTATQLPLTGEEIEEIRQAYRDGCKGEIIIGLRGDERVITMLVPAQTDDRASLHQEEINKHLVMLGCDSYLCIRKSNNN